MSKPQGNDPDMERWRADCEVNRKERERQAASFDKLEERCDRQSERFGRNHARFEAQMDRLDALLDKAGV